MCSSPVANPAHFKKLSFIILRLQLLGYNVNFVDGNRASKATRWARKGFGTR